MGERGGEGSGEGEVDLKTAHGWLCACPESRFLSSRPGVREAKGELRTSHCESPGPYVPSLSASSLRLAASVTGILYNVQF